MTAYPAGSLCPQLCPHSLAQMASVHALPACQSSGGDSVAYMTEESNSQGRLSWCTRCPQTDSTAGDILITEFLICIHRGCEHEREGSVRDGLTGDLR